MRFLLDMGASPRTLEFLRRHGHDAVHLRDVGMSRSPDSDAVAKAASESRVIVTFDLDFGRILAAQRALHPSMILFRLERFTTDQINERLLSILEECSNHLDQGAIIVVEPGRIRVRRLPIW
jgi:predicted nuclease of predicted toxin-antitoxin system